MASVGSSLPETNNVPKDFYSSKKMLKGLGLGYEKIDVCNNNCMLFYKENSSLDSCSVCGHARYKPAQGGKGRKKGTPYKVLRYLPLIPRLQRLYMSRKTAEHMTWHAKPRTEPVCHPSGSEAWKHFQSTYPDFKKEERNVYVAICTDGFTPFTQSAKPYSCWPVMVTVYNLPPSMCMTRPFIFLSLIIPGPKSPGKQLDVFLRPLIDELKLLWNEGIKTYDAYKKQNFQMRAAVMWTISDFPAFGMLCGWSTHGRLACPYCMERTKAFRLENGGKPSWFDCHRQFLPLEHPFRRQRDKFMTTTGRAVEKDLPIPYRSGEEMQRKISELTDRELISGFGKDHNWTKNLNQRGSYPSLLSLGDNLGDGHRRDT